MQNLEHSFIFLEDNNCKQVLEKLDIKWLLTFNKTDVFAEENFSSVIKTSLSGTELHLWKCKRTMRKSVSFDNICFVICTSGTTGDRKYVRVQNRCIYSNIKSIRYLCATSSLVMHLILIYFFREIVNITPNDVIYFGTSLTFDPSFIELFITLTTGATLFILPNRIHINPTHLYKMLFIEKNVTFLQMCPSVFLRFSQEQIDYIFRKSGLKTLCLGGEEFPVTLLDVAKKEDLRIFNLYGITEVSCWASIYEVKTEEVHLGQALAETIFEVRSENGNCIEEGVGEMFVGKQTSKAKC